MAQKLLIGTDTIPGLAASIKKGIAKNAASKFWSIFESSLKTNNFGLKPNKWLIFNCPDFKVGAIDMRDNQGFSHFNEIYRPFLDQAHI